jgi:hypothetical protein
MTGKNFHYIDTAWDETRKIVSFRYKIETNKKSFDLTETLELPASAPSTKEVEATVRALHLALGVSYYKAFIPPIIHHPYSMDNSEATFWNTVFTKGLSEFLYKNSLQPNKIASFNAQDGIKTISDETGEFTTTALLGIGGGKDSIVAGELLKQIDIQPTGFVLATGEILGQTRSVADTMNIDLLPVKRQIDLQILEISKLDGAYNGHIPISLVFALTGCLLAVCNRSKYIVVANEASASIPQVSWKGLQVNHQWSKSLEFEQLFQEYVHQYISKKMAYFSAIRPLTSIGIAKLFSTYPAYYNVFTSDNSVFRIKQGERDHPRWSVDSPKSLSSYILMAPWMNDKELDAAFGRNFLDLPELEELFISLLGRSNTPVLDCVGTPDELLFSLQRLYEQDRLLETALMKKAVNEGLVGNTKSTVVVDTIVDEHAFPEELAEKIKVYLQRELTEK